MQAVAKLFVHAFPSENLLAAHGAVVSKSEKLLAHAHTSNSESLTAQTLGRKTSGKTHKRLTDFVAQCSANIKADWKDAVHKDLVTLVMKVLDSDSESRRVSGVE